MRASPFFVGDEEVLSSVSRKGYATFMVWMLSTYLAELFDSIRRHTDKMDYNLAWCEQSKYYLNLLGIDGALLDKMLVNYADYIQAVEEAVDEVIEEAFEETFEEEDDAD